MVFLLIIFCGLVWISILVFGYLCLIVSIVWLVRVWVIDRFSLLGSLRCNWMN